MILTPNIRTRFAPSPTGFLHLGSARTALFNYLFAAHYKGKLIVRFEDTDQKRNVQNAIQQQLQSLRWLGIKIDETVDILNGLYGPYLQSERLDIYRKQADFLLHQKKAYYCFCTPNELQIQKKIQLQKGIKTYLYDRRCYYLEAATIHKFLTAKKPFCLRILVPQNQKLTFRDLNFGKMVFQTAAIEDFIIIKNNGFPTYNFAVVIDDYLMKITHIMRGSDHLSNTAKQIVLYQAYNWKIPVFTHFTLLQVDHQQKISKRNFVAEHYLEHYQKIGVLPIAMRNFLAFLGWSPKTKQEIFTDHELIEEFNGNHFTRSPSILDLGKLHWMNQKHIQNLSENEFWIRCQPFLQTQIQNSDYSIETWIKIICLFQSEVVLLSEITELVRIFTIQKITYAPAQKLIIHNNRKLLALFLNQIETKFVWNSENIRTICKQLQIKSKLKGKLFYHPLRIALTGQDYGPAFHNLIALLGLKKTLKRLKLILQNE